MSQEEERGACFIEALEEFHDALRRGSELDRVHAENRMLLVGAAIPVTSVLAG